MEIEYYIFKESWQRVDAETFTSFDGKKKIVAGVNKFYFFGKCRKGRI